MWPEAVTCWVPELPNVIVLPLKFVSETEPPPMYILEYAYSANKRFPSWNLYCEPYTSSALTFPLALILPVELILPKALTLKLLNEPDNAVTVALELMFPDAVISPNASTLNLAIDAEVAFMFFHFKAVEPKS